MEIDAASADLLVRALHGWIMGPSAPNEGSRTGDGQSGQGVEMVDWVSTDGDVVCSIPRHLVHAHNVLHRGVGILVTNDKGAIYCHQRSASKRVFPSLYDMFIGGVSASGETARDTAIRELGEELDLGKCPELLEQQFRCIVETQSNHCVVEVFDYACGQGEEVAWRDGEVVWGAYLEWEEVGKRVQGGEWEFVPDGLQVWESYLEWRAGAREG
ncbi:unnamed protein product [Discosporangium mesarthrocarpum]